MSWVRRSPLWLVCPAQHVSPVTTASSPLTHMHFSLSRLLQMHTNTVFAHVFDFLCLQHTRHFEGCCVWVVRLPYLCVAPGSMPSIPSFAVLKHSGTPEANTDQRLRLLSWGSALCQQSPPPLRSITKPNHWHCLLTLKLEPGESTDTGGHCQWAPLQPSGVEAKRVIASVIVENC